MIRRGASAALGVVVAIFVVLAILNAGRTSTARLATPVPSASPAPTASSKPALALTAAPSRSPAPTRATATATPAQEPTATPEALRAARIAHTGGAGVFLRKEPSAAGPSITALREGTTVTVLQREEVTAARVWRLVRDSRGLEGWVLGDFLEFLAE